MSQRVKGFGVGSVQTRPLGIGKETSSNRSFKNIKKFGFRIRPTIKKTFNRESELNTKVIDI